MPPEDTTSTAEEARAAEELEQAEFESGMPDPPKPAAKAEPAAKPNAESPKPDASAVVVKPKYVQVTEDQFAAWNAAAAKSASYEKQLSTLHGITGDMRKVLTALQSATPRGFKVEIPKDAFAAMERDFPEIAHTIRSGLEATLRGITGTGPANADFDPEQMTRLINEQAAKLRTDAEIEALEDEYPDWRKIVGQVDISKQQPDAANPFRKWLASKDAAYQARLNGTNSAAVISRAIRTFKMETKARATATPVPTLKAQLQAARIRDAVQPRGDGGQAAPVGADDDFEKGFASAR